MILLGGNLLKSKHWYGFKKLIFGIFRREQVVKRECNGTFKKSRGVTPIGDLVYMCLPGLWVSLRYFARFLGHVL